MQRIAASQLEIVVQIHYGLQNERFLICTKNIRSELIMFEDNFGYGRGSGSSYRDGSGLGCGVAAVMCNDYGRAWVVAMMLFKITVLVMVLVMVGW